MADDQEKLSGTSKNSPEEAEKLNIYSEKFDPVAFLRSDKVPLPKSDATTFDNLAMWYSSYTNKKRGEGTSKNTKKDAKSDLPVRRWLPHQLPIQSMQPTRILKNVFTRMEAVQGPLALLRKYVNEKTRIKVVTRNEKGVRGYCIASLLAFDKHTNLVLDEVHEVWRRSIKVKKCAQFMETDDNSTSHQSKNRIRIPHVETKKISKNTEECRRYVHQMLLRGEHVVLVSAAQNNE